MWTMKRYSQVKKYQVKAICTQPLHTSSAEGGLGEVLIHPVEKEPFLQASSLAGVFRSYYEEKYGTTYTDQLFGCQKDECALELQSRIRISDGTFDKSTVKMEFRPRIKIDPESKTADMVNVLNEESGQKFETEYVAAGARMTFYVYIIEGNKEDHNRFMSCLTDIHAGNIQFGGQKSNGCGCMKIEEIRYRNFNFKKKEDRQAWMDEGKKKDRENIHTSGEKLSKAPFAGAFDLWITCATEGELLVKGNSVTIFGKNTANVENMRNAQEEFIIPGSSLKGALRGRMMSICDYLNFNSEKMINEIFGVASNKKKRGKKGLVCFSDTTVGDQSENEKALLRRRIHIDKFTGGVMNSALFSEKNVAGTMQMHITIENGDYAAAACALMLLALRDMAAGQLTIGSGSSVGKGFVQISSIQITNNEGNQCCMDFVQKKTIDPEGMIDLCMEELKKKGRM